MWTMSTPNDVVDARLLTLPEVARQLGVSRSWIYREARLGRLPVVQLGHGGGRARVLRVRPQDIARMCEEQPDADRY